MKTTLCLAMLITVCAVITFFFWTAEPLQAQCVEFEDPAVGSTYHVGETFYSEGVLLSVRRFLWPGGQWYYDGYAQVSNNLMACHAGQDILTNNVNLAFDFNAPISSLVMYYGYYGGYLNIEVNGTFHHFGNFLDITGTTIGGVYITASAGQGCGVLTLSGIVNSFFVGGQELWIDHTCYEVAVEDSCVDFEDVPLAATYYVGDSFLSEGAVVTVRQFQYEGGTWTSSGQADASIAGFACHNGKEMRVNNVNLEVNFGHAVDGVSLYCGDLGGNDNIQINGDFANVPDIPDLAGLTLGGVDISVANGPGQSCWIVTLTGVVHVFFIGGQEFFLDHICPGEAVENACIDFEDVPLSDTYYTGSYFSSEGVTIGVKDFQWSNQQWTNNGLAQAGANLMACQLGHEMWTNNVNLEFTFLETWPGLSLYFGEYGGNLNLEVNGDFMNFDDFIDIHGQAIGGAAVTVTNGYGQGCGTLLLNGSIQTFAIGGQELWIDHICPEEVVEDSCVDFEDLILTTTYTVGNVFVSEGATITVEDFQWSGGTWTASGYTQVQNGGLACHLGQEMNLNNVNLRFDFGTSWTGLSLYFGEYGGNLNIDINSDFRNFEDFADIHGLVIGGVPVIVSGIAGTPCGTLLLAGEINTFAVGGQELWIDHVCPEDIPEDGACCLDDGSCVGTTSGLCNVIGGMYLGDGSACLGDANTNGIDDACEVANCGRGDVDCDMKINVLDVLAVINHILNEIIITDPQALWRADCNGDARINVLDALGIVNVILGIGNCAPGACKTTLTPETMAFIESFRSYLPEDQYAAFMALVKAEVGLPTEYQLSQNYPNPFNPTTAISYQLTATGSPLRTTLKVYNILGQEVATLVDELKEAGYYTVTWDASDMGSGVYFYRLTAGDFTTTRRMMLMK